MRKKLFRYLVLVCFFTYISNISSKFKSRPSSSSGSEYNWVDIPRVKDAEGAKANAEEAIMAKREMIVIFIFELLDV